MILNCFISSLVPETRRQIFVLQSTSITYAMGLAKLLESKIHDSRKYYHNPIILQPSPHLLPPPRPPFQPQTTTTTPTSLPIKNFHPPSYKNVEQLAYVTIVTKKISWFTNVSPNVSYCCLMNNLHQNHPPSPPQTFTVLDIVSDTKHPTHVHLSLQALSGTPSTNTFKLQGFIHHTPVTILIDTGSSPSPSPQPPTSPSPSPQPLHPSY